MFDINQILIRLYAHAYRKNDRAFDKDSKEIISEFERLDKDNEWLKADKEICNNTIQDLLKTNQMLKAENERLREENKSYKIVIEARNEFKIKNSNYHRFNSM